MAKRVGGMRALYPTDQAAAAMKGIIKSPFVLWIEKEERPKDFKLPELERYDGKGDPIAHLLYFKQRMSMERVCEALTCKLFATTLT